MVTHFILRKGMWLQHEDSESSKKVLSGSLVLNTFDALCIEEGSGNLREIYTMLFYVFISLFF